MRGGADTSTHSGFLAGQEIIQSFLATQGSPLLSKLNYPLRNQGIGGSAHVLRSRQPHDESFFLCLLLLSRSVGQIQATAASAGFPFSFSFSFFSSHLCSSALRGQMGKVTSAAYSLSLGAAAEWGAADSGRLGQSCLSDDVSEWRFLYVHFSQIVW